MEQAESEPIAADLASPDTLRVSLLGGFQVAVGARVIDPRAWRLRKASHLLKLLALAEHHQLHREQALDMLWPHLDAEAASNNLRVTLHFARKLLEPASGGGPAAFQARGEQLALFPDGAILVDVEQFESAARAAVRSDDPADYELALDLYAGELLPNDRFEDWAIERREALGNVHLSLLHGLALLRERRGEHDLGIETLRRALRDDPLSEPTHAGLIRLYAAAGRRPQALRQYQGLREILQRELDIEPDPETTRLYESILTGTFNPGQASATSHQRSSASPRSLPEPAPILPEASRTNLPAQLTSFVGRTRDMAALRQALLDHRLVTLTGPGGSGKTRIAIEVAASLRDGFRDGVWLVDLTDLEDAALVADRVATALGVQEVIGRPLVDGLAEALAESRTLIVLDNCEHLIEACASLVARLLRGGPGPRVLTTSREALRVPGEIVWPVPPLATPDPNRLPPVDSLRRVESVQLFVDRARLNLASFTVTDENAAAIAAVCHRLDGLPLAIELAAARSRALPISQIAGRLDDALRVLTAGSRAGPLHHRSLRAAIEWSHNLLNEPERRLLAQLSVFVGGFTIEAAEEICSVGDTRSDAPAVSEQIIDLLFGLVDKSLIIVEERDGDARYRLLETIRQFASERLRASLDEEQTRQRHARYFSELARDAEPRLLGPSQRLWQTRLLREHGNLRAALDAFLERHAAAGARMAGSLYMYWWFHGFLSEGLAICEAFLAWPDEDLPPRDRAWTLATAGLLASWHGQSDLGASRLNQALALWERLPDRRGAALCHLTLGIMAVYRGEYAAAEQSLRAGLALARQYGEDAFGAMILDSLSNAAVYRGDLTLALACSSEALQLAERAGDPGTFAHALINLADIRFRLDDLSGAMADANRGLALARELGERRPIAHALNLLGKIAIAQESFTAAARYSRESLDISRGVSDLMGMAYSLSFVAHAIGAGGRPRPAVRLLAATLAAREALAAPLRAEERERLDPLVERWRADLGDAEFDTLWAAGQALDLEAAADEALALDRVAAEALADQNSFV